MNDEAHHAYRIRREAANGEQGELFDEEFEDEEDAEDFFQEATVWIDGLDRIHKLRGINVCIDLSATPYFLGRVGQETNRPFPWVVSDFGLIDAIESGLVKIPQLAVRDTTGAAIPGYFNIWHWILPKLTPAERGGKRANPKPEAILKWAHTPIAMLGGLWEATTARVDQGRRDPARPSSSWSARTRRSPRSSTSGSREDKAPTGIPPVKIDTFRNRDGRSNTIRVDSKVVHETDSGEAKSDETRWMRFTLDTVGKTDWPRDRQGRPIYPDGFEELAKKLERPLHPPGRDVRCIVSVGMLTEGWDCSTVTHIVGLRPFMSQLLCEQVVGPGLAPGELRGGRERPAPRGDGQGLRRAVRGDPVQGEPPGQRPRRRSAITCTRSRQGGLRDQVPARRGIHAGDPQPRGGGLGERPRSRIDPGHIPPEVEVKAWRVNNGGRPSLTGPGREDEVSLT